MQTLDLVVPFTTPNLTRIAIRAAESFARGLSAGIRLLRIQVLPYPDDTTHPAVPLGFLREQTGTFRSAIPMRAEVVLTRDYESQLEEHLTFASLVALAARHHSRFSRTNLLARRLRNTGHKIVLVYEEKNVA